MRGSCAVNCIFKGIYGNTPDMFLRSGCQAVHKTERALQSSRDDLITQMEQIRSASCAEMCDQACMRAYCVLDVVHV